MWADIACMDMLDKGIHVLGGIEQDSMNFHHPTQNDMQFKTYELFISGIFHFNIFKPRLTETMESKTMDQGGLL